MGPKAPRQRTQRVWGYSSERLPDLSAGEGTGILGYGGWISVAGRSDSRKSELRVVAVYS
jgi:hypothetical protein